MSTNKRLQKLVSFVLTLSILLSLFTTTGFSAPPQIGVPNMEENLNGVPGGKQTSVDSSPEPASPEPTTAAPVQITPVQTAPLPPVTTPAPTPAPAPAPAALPPTLTTESISTADSIFTHPFPDVAGHWAENPIMYMNDRGILNLYPDGTIKPDSPITREEFAYSLSKWLGANSGLLNEPGHTPSKIGASFKDLEQSSFAGEINKIASLGIMNGSLDSFRPGDNLTREEAGSVLANLFKVLENSSLSGKYFEGIPKSSRLVSYSDSASISDWAIKPVAAVTEMGFMTGYPDGTFKPQGVVTRAEAYTILSKAELSLKEQIPTGNVQINPEPMKLVRVYAKNLDEAGFDLELTVNNTAAELNPYVLLAYTNDVNKAVDETNIGTDMYGVSTRKVRLKELTNVSSFAYQSIYSTNINVSFPNTYYAYVKLQEEGQHTDVKHCVVYVNDLTEPSSRAERLEYVETVTGPALVAKYITLEKVDGDGAPLSGAEFELRDSSGNVLSTRITPEDGRIVFDGLAEGVYEVREVNPPAGYENSGYRETVALTEATPEILLKVTNLKITDPKPEPKPELETAKLIVKKVDANDEDSLLEGAFFDLTNIQSGELIESLTSGESLTVYENLLPGTYSLTEIVSPYGYQPIQEPIYVVITGTEVKEITVPNYKNIPIMVRKIDRDDETPLPGAVFRLTGNGVNMTKTTGEDGTAVFSGLSTGTYSLREITAPPGYVLNSTARDVVVRDEDFGGIVTVDWANEKTPETGTLSVRKVDPETGEGIYGACFKLENSNGEEVGYQKWSNYNGYLEFTGLEYGTYTLTEVIVPPGYEIIGDNPQTVVIDSPRTNIIVYNELVELIPDHEYDLKVELWWEANSHTDLDLWVHKDHNINVYVCFYQEELVFSPHDNLWFDHDFLFQGSRALPEIATSLGNRGSTLSVVVDNYNGGPLTENPVIKVFRRQNGVDTLVRTIEIDRTLLRGYRSVLVCDIDVNTYTVREFLTRFLITLGPFQ